MKCFVIMPFRPEFDDVFSTIKAAVAEAGAGHAVRLDEVRAAGRITSDLLAELRSTTFCIADLTDLNPNVMWETGYAEALLKPTIIIRQSRDRLPFDIQDARVEHYSPDDLASLHDRLTRAVSETLARYQLRTIELPPKTARTIAVTGSMLADTDRVIRRLETLLPPFFGNETTWYVGTVGNVDEAAAQYLFTAQQRVIAVGYEQWDISGRMLKLLEEHQARFVDASHEQLLHVPGAPTPREVLFAQKADLIVLVWDGQSRTTREIAEWLTSQGQSHLLTFA